MGEWKNCTLSSLGTIVGGATPSTKKPENYEGGEIPWITPKDLSGFSGRYISCGERNITEIGLKSCSAQMMPKHSVLFSSRAPIGYVAISDCDVCTNQGFKSIVPNKDTDYLFLYYLLLYKKHEIENLGSGTTFKEVSASTMKGIEVRVPIDKREQERIAGILSALDDKIESNAHINENLEQQISSIYANLCENKSWDSCELGSLIEVRDGTHDSPKDFYENEELIAITKELADTLRKNKTIDWQRKESARAKMRTLIKRLLKKHKYPPEGMDDAVQTVMTQCELWTDNVMEA